ncbi:MAG: FIST C-terminal domain-containing protein [Cyanobacteria bacterium P01_H01_bin.15]
MEWTNALSTRPSLEAAVTDVVAQIKQKISGTPELGIVFISAAFNSEFSRLIPLLKEQLPLKYVIGCGGGGIVGTTESPQEIEAGAALSLTVAHFPETTITPFYLAPDTLPDLDASPQIWANLLQVPTQENLSFLLLAAPLASNVTDLLAGLDFAYPHATKVGGLASTLTLGSGSGLFLYERDQPISTPSFFQEGTVGIALSGRVTIDAVVAQGCRPVGPLYQITRGERFAIAAVSEFPTGQSEPLPPLMALQNLLNDLTPRDRQLAQHSLFIGIVRDEFKQTLGQGDFLIRNLIDVDPQSGSLAVGDRIREGQRIQFHLRDAQTSADDLNMLLETYEQPTSQSEIVGALMFACLGRGQGLYEKPNFDSQLLCGRFPGIALGGFFCNGEIGPVAGQTFLHGYTSVFALFRDRAQ